MFCDELNIKVKAGNGGNGCMSFRREKFIPKGGPDGGDGGNGGNIILIADKNLNNLGPLAQKKVYKAENGVSGMGKKMHGRNGKDLKIFVPVGTIVFNKNKTKVLADLDTEKKSKTIVKGGKGGLGNARFATAVHRTPRFAETGEPGEEMQIVLELKLVADIGLIGLPSTGKSTLISVISNAKPKIAAYHFTTLSPNLGIVDMRKFGASSNDNFIVADIPGLIKGASKGKGLGHKFLKHISRTRVLIHLIDITSNNIQKDYEVINKELKNFDKDLAKKKQLIALNKIDILDEDEIKVKLKSINFKSFHLISALSKKGLKPLIFDCIKALKSEKNVKKESKTKKALPVLKPHLKNKPISLKVVSKKDGSKTFEIDGEKINRLVIMTDIKNKEGLYRIYKYLEKSGLQKELKQKKASPGDNLKINGKLIPYQE
ncbi:GTPase ObgE [Candidatus Peregrinibacteria bacterium]|nr:GTPase ObgE [Candidatus Peregrinibacteria bacterium]